MIIVVSHTTHTQCFPDKSVLLEKAKIELKSLTNVHEVSGGMNN